MNITTPARLCAVVAVTVAAAGAWHVAGASPAAALMGLTVTSVVTEAGSTPTRSLSAACSAGKRVIGGGGIVDGADGKAWITTLQPVSTSGGDRFDVTAVETDDGFAGNWWLRAFVICADPVPGLQVVSAVRGSSSATFQQHSALCPNGKQLLGAGGRIHNPDGQVALQAVTVGSGQAASVAGREDRDGSPSRWNLIAYAVCANPVAGYSLATGTSTSDSTDAKLATAACPAGRKAHASMFSVSTTSGDVVVESAHPGGDLGSVHAVAREQVATSANWSVTAVTVCAT